MEGSDKIRKENEALKSEVARLKQELVKSEAEKADLWEKGVQFRATARNVHMETSIQMESLRKQLCASEQRLRNTKEQLEDKETQLKGTHAMLDLVMQHLDDEYADF